MVTTSSQLSIEALIALEVILNTHKKDSKAFNLDCLVDAKVDCVKSLPYDPCS